MVMGLWKWPWTQRSPSGFDGGSTAEEVTAGVDASHLTAIVTASKVKESLADQVAASKLHVMEMDLSSLSSVHSFAQSFNSSHEHLTILMYVAAPSLRYCQFLELDTAVVQLISLTK
ncbi:hypothetical protein PR202_ga25146 [Eleusine coracana subsp. coracana]|uniref:Uncharacterized protein n=1 Tax=Eleusine coracana subsp. coracana TaxID=191504 RepID=A0AAV5DA81_ELECO|nr:hypothetical protein PR202_ga25146 [Eleusine coracana subsp. coracana]